ncbi:MAG: methionyl-tRNA formyltransferase [Termitinemataceae bacterium]
MRIVFAGSPDIAVPSFCTLVEKYMETGKHPVVAVLTNPDSRKGRKGNPEPTPIGAAAQKLAGKLSAAGREVPVVIKAEKLDASVRETIAALNPDILVSFAYGKIFGPKFLGLFPRGGINIHPSLLPKYRGATPIPAAILHRDTETGISIQTLALEMDAGDILIQERRPLDGTETTESLSVWAAERSAQLLIPLIDDLAEGMVQGRPQDHSRATYCSIISKEDGWIQWNESALTIDAKIRAYTPWPLCATHHRGQILYILKACPYTGGTTVADGHTTKDIVSGGQPDFMGMSVPGMVLGIDKQVGILIQTGDGIVAVQRLQYATKKPLDWKSFLNGAKDFVGSLLE